MLAAVREAFAYLISTEDEVLQCETQYVRKEGTTAIVPANSVALRDEHNTISGLTSTMTDVTE